jgi:hypothetical protein
MTNEVFPQGAVAEQTAAFELNLRLQQTLNASPEEVNSLLSVRVGCPQPGEGREQSLGEFMLSPHSVDVAPQIIDTAREARESGAGLEDSLHRALGFAATKDRTTGKLVRVAETTEALKKK